MPPPCPGHAAHHLKSVVIETKNRTLEETAALFDGDEVTEQIAGIAAQQAGVTHDIGVTDEKSSGSFHEQAPVLNK